MSEHDEARVLDRLEIRDLLARYGRSIQLLDEAGLREVFQPDAVVDKGPGPVGVDEYLPDVIRRNSRNLRAALQVTNVLVDFLGPDRAFAETSAIELAHAPSRSLGGLADTVYWVRYADIVERRDDLRWRIVERRLVIDHVMRWPGTDPETTGVLDGFFVGRRDADDPILRFRRDFGV